MIAAAAAVTVVVAAELTEEEGEEDHRKDHLGSLEEEVGRIRKAQDQGEEVHRNDGRWDAEGGSRTVGTLQVQEEEDTARKRVVAEVRTVGVAGTAVVAVVTELE
jgi:hypothetical protein